MTHLQHLTNILAVSLNQEFITQCLKCFVYVMKDIRNFIGSSFNTEYWKTGTIQFAFIIAVLLY